MRAGREGANLPVDLKLRLLDVWSGRSWRGVLSALGDTGSPREGAEGTGTLGRPLSVAKTNVLVAFSHVSPFLWLQ
jgi:hypothetical protein